MTPSAEQLARNMLERMGVENAQSITSEQLEKLAELMAEHTHATNATQAATLALYKGARPSNPEDADEAQCIGRSSVGFLAPFMDSQAVASADTPKDFLNPEWTEGGAVHNWHNHVSEELQAMWPSFNQEQRAALARQAQAQADNEEWD